nr:Gag-Pol polyprotein [Tanacetum cinerariifolium]
MEVEEDALAIFDGGRVVSGIIIDTSLVDCRTILWYLDSDCSKHMTGHYDKQAQVSLKATVRYLRTDNVTEFINQTLRNYTKDVGITHTTSTARTLKQNGVVERRNRTLVEVARTMLIFSKSPLFLWAEAVATACYTKNRSLIHPRYNKTLYELLRDRKPELKFLYVFGALCYPTNDSEDLRKLQPKADIGVFIVYSPSKKTYRISAKSSSRIINTSNMHTFQQPQINTRRWKKEHPLVTIIGNPSKPISTRCQLATNALWCYFHAFLVKEKPKNYKETMNESSWIEAMQDEIHEFERLEVSELVSKPDKVMIINLKSNELTLQNVDDGKNVVFLRITNFIFQSPKGILINQSKYAFKMLKKYGLDQCEPVDIPMVERLKLNEDPDGTLVDLTHYGGMVGSLMYLTAVTPPNRVAAKYGSESVTS